jgi:hypothetical protein
MTRKISMGDDHNPESFFRALLDLADNPADVVALAGENAAEVADYVADRFFADEGDDEGDDEAKPPRKRASRARKAEVSDDD